GLEGAAIILEGGPGRGGAEMAGKGIAEPQLPGRLGAGAGRAEQPDRRQLDPVRRDAQRREGMLGRKRAGLEGEQLGQLLAELGAAEGAQRLEGAPVGAAGAPDAEVD